MIREYKAMHAANLLSSWLRENVDGKAEEMEDMRKRTKENKLRVEQGSLREKQERLAVVCVSGRVLRRIWKRKWWICRVMRVGIGVR